ncbi:hypothetical protein V1286_002072 [Bradyrhizobium algeriense]|uniref:Uncharacterized protein n=1 Tax=Bradyrhizobium algeriense TaxID=634784 RepID=A0ABU8B968_9BRAD
MPRTTPGMNGVRGMKLGWAVTTDHLMPPDAGGLSAYIRGPFYFAWGCFRDFVSRPAVYRRRVSALRPAHEIASASR